MFLGTTPDHQPDTAMAAALASAGVASGRDKLDGMIDDALRVHGRNLESYCDHMIERLFDDAAVGRALGQWFRDGLIQEARRRLRQRESQTARVLPLRKAAAAPSPARRAAPSAVSRAAVERKVEREVKAAAKALAETFIVSCLGVPLATLTVGECREAATRAGVEARVLGQIALSAPPGSDDKLVTDVFAMGDLDAIIRKGRDSVAA